MSGMYNGLSQAVIRNLNIKSYEIKCKRVCVYARSFSLFSGCELLFTFFVSVGLFQLVFRSELLTERKNNKLVYFITRSDFPFVSFARIYCSCRCCCLSSFFIVAGVDCSLKQAGEHYMSNARTTMVGKAVFLLEN